MTLEEESRLSFYRELTVLDEKKNIVLVQDIRNSELCVKKILYIYSKLVYRQLLNTYVYGVPDVVECIEDGDKLIVIEEYIPGKNLNEIIMEYGLFDEWRAYHIAVELAQILVELQRMNPAIVHRDIKPSNIIVESNGHIHLVDFNIAKIIKEKSVEDTTMLGTIYFAAPEQYGFSPSDKRTDIYGWGATINYIMTGEKPSVKVANCQFSDILKKCLMLDANDRYKSAEELLDELNNVNQKNKKSNRKKYFYNAYLDYKNDKNLIKKLRRYFKEYDLRQKAINKSWKRFLLPGFRCGNIGYCIMAILWYLFWMWMILTFETTDSKTSKPVIGIELLLYKIVIGVIVFGLTLWFGNYLNIRRKILKIRETNVKSILLTIIFALAYILFVALIIILII